MRRTKSKLSRWLWHGVALSVALIFLWPLLGMLAASLRPAGLPPSPSLLEWPIPSPSWGNYARIFELVPLGRYGLNSLLVAGLAVPLTLLTASWAGLALAQMASAEQNDWLVFSLALLMVPGAALWIGRLISFNALGLINTYGPLIAPALMGANPLFVLLFYWAFRQIPRELFDEARVAGAHALDIWWYVALPLARPMILAVGLLAFGLFWGDVIPPLLYLKSQALYTLPVGVQQLQQMDRTNSPLIMAAATLMTAPVVIFFLIAQVIFLRQDRNH